MGFGPATQPALPLGAVMAFVLPAVLFLCLAARVLLPWVVV